MKRRRRKKLIRNGTEYGGKARVESATKKEQERNEVTDKCLLTVHLPDVWHTSAQHHQNDINSEASAAERCAAVATVFSLFDAKSVDGVMTIVYKLRRRPTSMKANANNGNFRLCLTHSVARSSPQINTCGGQAEKGDSIVCLLE